MIIRVAILVLCMMSGALAQSGAKLKAIQATRESVEKAKAVKSGARTTDPPTPGIAVIKEGSPADKGSPAEPRRAGPRPPR